MWGNGLVETRYTPQTVANNTSRLIRNVCQMKAQQRSRERRRKEQRRGSEISLANHRMVRVCLLARFPQSLETSRISEFRLRIMYDRDNGGIEFRDTIQSFPRFQLPPRRFRIVGDGSVFIFIAFLLFLNYPSSSNGTGAARAD